MKYSVLGSIVAVLMVLLSLPQNSWSQVQGIDGTWYIGEKPVSVEIYDHGWRFSLTDESGHKSTGKAFNEEVIYLPSENISGQIEMDGTVITWSDGTYWAREAFTGPEPPNLPE
ncbi:MAG: hypothetical protein E4H21_03355 [Thermodesulfobacteriales bacterium]|nr:MAG: hypothetical protein E4H21_03355 [Thermodesulfobacteriales bacterium]